MNKLQVFSASWCMPCKQLKGVLEGVTLPNTVVEILVIDESHTAKELAVQAGIRSVPTLVLTSADGSELKRTTGSKTKEQLLAFVG